MSVEIFLPNCFKIKPGLDGLDCGVVKLIAKQDIVGKHNQNYPEVTNAK